MGKFQAYPDYVDSGLDWLGHLPAGWKTERAKLVFREINERSEDGSEQLLSVSEYYGVKPRSEVIEEGEYLSRAESLEGYKKCELNDLVMNIMLAWKRGLAFTRFAGIVSPAYSVFRLRKPYEPSYLNYLLRTDVYTGLFKRWSTGVIDSRLRLYPEVFGALPVVVPPLPEQCAIAAFLDHETAKIDRLIAKQERLIELLKEKRQAVISHAVTKGLNPDAPMKDSGVEWLGEVPAHWVVCALKFGWNVIDCKHVTAPFVDDGIPLASIREVQSRVVNLSEAKKTTREYYLQLIEGGRKPRPGDIIYSRNATVGEAALVVDGPEFAMGQDVALMRPNNQDSNYFLYQLESKSIASQLDLLMVGATFKRINVGDIKNLLVAYPPLDEQQQIARHLSEVESKFDRLSTCALRAVGLLREHRTALISAAVTGKIDVRGWQKSNNEPQEAATAAST